MCGPATAGGSSASMPRRSLTGVSKLKSHGRKEVLLKSFENLNLNLIDMLLTADVVARLIGCDRNSLYRAAARKIDMPIPYFVKLGRQYRFRLSDVQAFIDGLCARPDDSKLSEFDAYQGKSVKRGRPTKAAQLARKTGN
jgi:hypothetical protein